MDCKHFRTSTLDIDIDIASRLTGSGSVVAEALDEDGVLAGGIDGTSDTMSVVLEATDVGAVILLLLCRDYCRRREGRSQMGERGWRCPRSVAYRETAETSVESIRAPVMCQLRWTRIFSR